MKIWAVHLTLILGDIEKATTNFVEASTEREACKQALLDECHFEPSWEDDDGSKRHIWDGGMYVYKVHSACPVGETYLNDQVAVLRSLGFAI